MDTKNALDWPTKIVLAIFNIGMTILIIQLDLKGFKILFIPLSMLILNFLIIKMSFKMRSNKILNKDIKVSSNFSDQGFDTFSINIATQEHQTNSYKWTDFDQAIFNDLNNSIILSKNDEILFEFDTESPSYFGKLKYLPHHFTSFDHQRGRKILNQLKDCAVCGYYSVHEDNCIMCEHNIHETDIE